MNERKKLSADVIAKIKHVEIRTRALLRGCVSGDHVVNRPGFGMDFDQIRDYQQGDDIRFIDWKGTARLGKTVVKQYHREENRIIWLLVDVSASTEFTSGATPKNEILQLAAAVVATIGSFSRDTVGLILFSDRIEACIPPANGRSHIHTLMETLFSCRPIGKRTDVQVPFAELMRRKARDAVVFFVSDCLFPCDEAFWVRMGDRYDTTVLHIVDKNEQKFPCVGRLQVQDSETGSIKVLDGHTQALLSIALQQHWQQYKQTFKKCGIGYLADMRQDTFVEDIVSYFRQRVR